MHASPLYVAIDLGSNSFHMLVAREVAGSIQTVDKIKRKVRLASGLDKNNHLSKEAMHRGWNCLSLFAERLQDIEPEHIRVVGTATLRTAVNINAFLTKAEDILGHKIEVISGETGSPYHLSRCRSYIRWREESPCRRHWWCKYRDYYWRVL